MRAPAVQFVVTEHPPAVSARRARQYEAIRRLIERVARGPVASRAYTDLEGLDAADALVLSGSYAPWAVHDRRALAAFGDALQTFDGPVLGICAGMQLMVMLAGGSVAAAPAPKVGFEAIEVLDDSDLLRGLPPAPTIYEHHSDEVVALPAGFNVLARSRDCAVEAIAAPQRRWWGTQFHPESFSTAHPAGGIVLRNFFALVSAVQL